MKVRNGFVSNSSSSSFIIKTHKDKFIPHPDGTSRVQWVVERQLSKEQEDALLSYGFNKNNGAFDENDFEYTLEVSCNQDCCIKYLILHNIPFEATCNYGTDFYSWDGKSDNLVYLRNFGAEFSMYSSTRENVDNLFKESPGRYVPLKQFTDCECEYMIGCLEHV